MDVVVVGGGIVGVASAHALAELGADVTVCEAGSLGAGSTDRAVGGIRAQFSTPVNVELSTAAMTVWDEFEETFGVDIGYRRPGYLFLARETETASRFTADVVMQQRRGVPSRLLDPEEARDYCPELRADAYERAAYAPTDGFADPHLALQGYAEAARLSGVELRTNTPVTDVLTVDGEVVGVEADGERLDAEFVVNAAGAWGAEVAALAGLDLPVRPSRRQALVVEPETPMPERVALTVDLDTGLYFRPERDGAAIVGGHFAGSDPAADPDDYRESHDLDWATEALERAADCAGYFGPESRIRRGWAGLYAVTPDRHPIIEETLPGFVNAVGFSGHGFQHAPATGQLVAELVHDGEASLVDIDSLGAERFENGGLELERNVA
ncbi:MAG: FAD-dependent oxidoreductase [Halobacteriales archaeon]|nr:FAD-dependent oxidoreductase [Halobacteriales archaeon]